MAGNLRDHLLRLFLPLVVVNVLALLIRMSWDLAGTLVHPYMATFFHEQVLAIAELPWWHILLPLKDFGGRWGPAGFLLINQIETWIGEPSAFYLLNSIMVSTGYLLSFFVFRSYLLSFLAGLALATTTFNYHVYLVSGSVIMLPLTTFLFLFSFSQYQYVKAGKNSSFWLTATTITGAAFALSYEGWLDFVPLAWIALGTLSWCFWSAARRLQAMRCLILVSLSTFMAIVYILVKVAYGLADLHPKGGEADLLITYGPSYPALIVEDMISSFFTFFYTTFSTYLPPELFSFSVSLWKYGPETVVALQDGYHPQASHLVLYNHLFLWRFYAGFTLALVLIWYWRAARRLANGPTDHDITIFVLLSCLLIGSPTHLIIKWRPMHAAPFLGYQVYLSVMGLTLLIAYMATTATETYKKWRRPWGMVVPALVALDLLYCAYARPSIMATMSSQTFLGRYSDPRVNFPEWLRHRFKRPRNGLGLGAQGHQEEIPISSGTATSVH